MIDSIDDFLANREPPLCVIKTETVRNALSLMVDYDFSQLPIKDENGDLVGLISEQSINRFYFHFDKKSKLLDTTVERCMDEAITIPREDASLFTILERLNISYAVVIIDGRKPIGIVTHYDTTQVFREWSEGLIRIRNIELTLRQYIENIYDTEEKMNAALHRALGSDKKDPHNPRKPYNELTFSEHVQLIQHEKNWSAFSQYFEPDHEFQTIMGKVGEARNKLAHFRGSLNAVELDAVKVAERWVSHRPRVKVQEVEITDQETMHNALQGEGKYGRLEVWLAAQAMDVAKGATIKPSFQYIEGLIEEPLPIHARQHRAWWANDLTTQHGHSGAWLRSGWVVSDVDFSNELVSFRRDDNALYLIVWLDLIGRLRQERPGLRHISKSYLQNWCPFDAGKPGFYYAWAFSPDKRFIRTQLDIDTRHSDPAAAKYYFRQLEMRRSEIEFDFGDSLIWEDDPKKKAVKIYAEFPTGDGGLTDIPEEAKRWAVTCIQRLADSMQPRIVDLQDNE